MGRAIPNQDTLTVVASRITLQIQFIRSRPKEVVGFPSPLAAQINDAISGNFFIHHASTNNTFGFKQGHSFPLFHQPLGCDQTRQACTNDYDIHRGAGDWKE